MSLECRNLGQRFVYEEESPEMPEEEFDVSLNTSLPRKLFNDNSLDEEDMVTFF